jgi:autotransporter-associated beta strand protein
LTLTGNSTGDNEIKLALGDNGASALSVTKTGGGLWLLSGSNTYTGVTTISAGVLQAQDGVGLPTSSNLWITGAGVFQSSGTFTRTLGTGAGQVQIPNSGGFAASSSKLTVNLLGAATLGTAPMATSTLVLNSTTALADVEFASPLSLGTAARTIQVDDNANTAFDFATVSGVLSGAAASSVTALSKTGAGNLILSGANTYTGSTQVSQGALIVRSIGTLNATSSNLGTNSTNAGSLLLGNGATAATLLYVGPGEVTTRTVALASTSGAVTIDSSGSGPLQLSTVSNSGGGAKTLTLRGFNTDMNLISGTLANNGASALTVTKTDAGLWVLAPAAPNTFTGALTVNAGMLGLNANGVGPGGLTLASNGGGIFGYGGPLTLGTLVTIGAGSTALFGGANPITLTGTSAAGGIALAGAINGDWTLNSSMDNGALLTVGSFRSLEASTSRTLNIRGYGSTTFSGGILNSAGAAPVVVDVRLDSGATLTLSGSSNFSGGLNVYQGTILLNNATAPTSALSVTGSINSRITLGGAVLRSNFAMTGASSLINEVLLGGDPALFAGSNSIQIGGTLYNGVFSGATFNGTNSNRTF